MAYVSCKYGPPPDPISQQQIVCVDEAGTDWLRFKEDGGEVTPYQPLQEPA